MAAASPMTRNELLELAALDAFGLLDKYETDLYTRSFHHAPAAVQDEVLELQAQIVAETSLLPLDLPPEDLRQKVLQRVAAAVEASESDLAPLATIGRSRALITGGSAADSPARHRSIVSRQFWRAATFVLFAAVIVMGYMLNTSIQHSNTVTLLAFYDINAAQLEEFLGRETAADFLANPALQHVTLMPQDQEADYWAAVLTIEGGQRGLLIIEGLPGGKGYELAVTDGNGSVYTVTEFESLRRRGGVAFTLASNVALGPNAKWEIRRDGELLLASA